MIKSGSFSLESKLQIYVDGVLDGSIVSGELTRLAVKRYQRDLNNKQYYFDEKAARHAIHFFETFLHHTTGRWAGNLFILEPWQVFIIANIFGFKKHDGTRRFRIAYNEVARKNGKSTLAAGIGVYCLIADNESRAEVFSAATKKDQAKIVFSEAKRMIKSSPDLKRFAKILVHNISVSETYSKFEALGADSDTMDGLNIHCAIIDELHAHKSREMWDVLLTATGARSQPLIFSITTAGFDKSEASICWLQHEYSGKILKGEIEDDSYFAFIATLNDGDKWEDEKNWKKSNPNLGVSLNIEDLRQEADRAKKAPTSLNPFLRYKMNIWTAAEKSWLTGDQWNACNLGEIDPLSLEGKVCYLGMDLAKKVDTSALVLVFPPENETDNYIVLPFIFLPGETLADRQRTERIPWLDWKKRNLIFTTQGKVTQIEEILDMIEILDGRYQIKDIMYDRWRAPEILPQLEEIGWSADPNDSLASRYLIEHGQGFKDMSPAIRNLEELAISGRINHGGHEVLAWQVSCVAISEDDAGNVKFSKRKSKGKIDAVVSLAMAAYRAKVHPQEEKSVYDERGILFV
jgi:phage terminase large subunit-like protein